jgi:hypothetical protein
MKARTEEGRAFLKEIRQALVKCCGKTTAQAGTLTRQYFSHLRYLEDDIYLYRETPYHYAMCIAHHPVLGDNQPEWYFDQRYWPPPEWIVRKYYSHA